MRRAGCKMYKYNPLRAGIECDSAGWHADMLRHAIGSRQGFAPCICLLFAVSSKHEPFVAVLLREVVHNSSVTQTFLLPSSLPKKGQKKLSTPKRRLTPSRKSSPTVSVDYSLHPHQHDPSPHRAKYTAYPRPISRPNPRSDHDIYSSLSASHLRPLGRPPHHPSQALEHVQDPTVSCA